MRASQEMIKRRKTDKRKLDDRRAQLKAIVASTAQRRSHMKVSLPRFSFQNEKDQP